MRPGGKFGRLDNPRRSQPLEEPLQEEEHKEPQPQPEDPDDA